MATLDKMKQQIRFVLETSYGDVPAAPTYTDDPFDKYGVIDVESAESRPAQNIQYVKTIESIGDSAAALGNFEFTGTFRFPMRMRNIPLLNLMLMGRLFGKTITDPTTGEKKYYYVSLPASSEIQSFTGFCTFARPDRYETWTGSVVNNLSLDITPGNVVTGSLDWAAQKVTIKYSVDAGTTVPSGFEQVSLKKADVLASQDVGIYGDIQIVQNASDIPSDSEVIDYIYSWDSTNSTIEIVGYICGKFISTVKSATLNMNIETGMRDSHRVGDRFAQEYGMRTLMNKEYTLDLTVDYNTESHVGGQKNDFMSKILAYVTNDGTVSANQVDLSNMGIVMKFGSALDLRDTMLSPTIKAHTGALPADPETLLGSKNRWTLICPNVFLDLNANVTVNAGALPELRLTARMLPGKVESSVTMDSIIDGNEYTFDLNDESIISLIAYENFSSLV